MSTMDKNIQFLYGKGLTNNVPFSAGAIYLDTLNKQLWYDDPAGEITEHTLLTTPDEIYVGNGEMPDDATIQILMDGSDEEQSFKDELKEYIDSKMEDIKNNIMYDIMTQLQGLPVFGVLDENNTITVTSQLSDGTYVLKYENTDGTTTEIGTVIVGTGTGESSNGEHIY